jgi:hypothetical protein
MKILVNENGLDACIDSSAMDSEEVVIARIHAAQEGPLTARPLTPEPEALEETKVPDEDEPDEDDIEHLHDPNNCLGDEDSAVRKAGQPWRRRNDDTFENPPPAPADPEEETPNSQSQGKEEAAPDPNYWRSYTHGNTGRQVPVPCFLPHDSDSEFTHEKKQIFHAMLESFAKAFIDENMNTEAHRVVHFLTQNNKSTLRAMNEYTNKLHKEFLALLPVKYEGSDVEKRTLRYVACRKGTAVPAADVQKEVPTAAAPIGVKRKSKLNLRRYKNKRAKVTHVH